MRRVVTLALVLTVFVAVFFDLAAAKEEECKGLHKPEPKPDCHAKNIEYAFSGTNPSMTARVLFWIVVLYVVLGAPFGLYIAKRQDPESPYYVPQELRFFKHDFPLWHSYKQIFSNAIFIIIAMLLSNVVEAVFKSLYLYFTTVVASEEETCPHRTGTYSCTYGEEEAPEKWMVILPAFVAALLIVGVTLWGIARCFSRFWCLHFIPHSA